MRVIVCLCFLLQVWSKYHRVSGSEETRINATSTYFRINAWELVEVGNKAVTSLSELTDGVFSFELLAERSDCGRGTFFFTTDMLHGIHIIHAFLIFVDGDSMSSCRVPGVLRQELFCIIV